MELTEHDEQALLIKWFDLQYKDKFVLFAIPNGGIRNVVVAKKLKKEGVRSGVPDLFLAVPKNPYAGLFIEMKRAKGGKLSLYQKDMITSLEDAGYRCEVCHGFEQAKLVIEDYLKNERYKRI